MKLGITLSMCYCLSIICADACTHSSTKIMLAKIRSPRWLDDKVDVIVVGKNGQQIGRNNAGLSVNDMAIGAMNWSLKNDIYINDEDNCVQLIPIKKSTVIHIAEPLITKEWYWSEGEKKDIWGYVYEVKKRWRRGPKKAYFFEFFGNDALKEAKRDLTLCYEGLLKSIFNHMSWIREKSAIAIFPLGIDTGVPWKDVLEIAVDSVCNYVKVYPHHYTQIYLCVLEADAHYCSNQIYDYYEQLLFAREQAYYLEALEKKYLSDYFLVNDIK